MAMNQSIELSGNKEEYMNGKLIAVFFGGVATGVILIVIIAILMAR